MVAYVVFASLVRHDAVSGKNMLNHLSGIPCPLDIGDSYDLFSSYYSYLRFSVKFNFKPSALNVMHV